jgi:demethoxyubiquinone hydroxylase (CLK1/Coq7/Cat5 family)
VPKNIIFYLELFKLIFALAFSSLTTKKLNSLTTSQIEKMMAEHYEEATRALHPYIKK